ncbi:two-component system response regulator HydG [Prolixibacter denitrificans]|uniref:Sigma-54-dependent Fis family transcriptional regulator n=2 Tax=Prolixibacter denitrificans TaxID=1541063 RepID=A0A2P8C7Y3_9BACT|nr:two-component system response regulator HydG [Prolixibacter denitrificans]GET22189.1 sigma-54-dependent Fis family transcriptional regulator [Prolixibacter denitrificans]
MDMPRLLIVDDDTSFCMLLQGFLKRKGFDADTAHDYEKASQSLAKNSYDLVLTDYRLPDGTGIDVLKESKKLAPSTVVILITAYSDIRVAVEAVKLGAFEYVTKPVNSDELFHVIKEGLKKRETQEKKTKEPVQNGRKFLVGNSEESKRTEEHIRIVAPTDISVLIIGDSGTGKEYVARRIHELSKRKKAPFVAVDCGALHPDIAASELFGHVKGSFTGAVNDKTGHFEAVGEGTIFLDEIGNLSYDVQMKLLRAIQERMGRKVGGNSEFPIKARIIAATNENLKQAVDEGRFREDLYHRLNEFTLTLAPLHERDGDLMMFAAFFLEDAVAEFGKSIIGFDDEVQRIFTQYDWPGNLREMRNVIRRAVLLCKQEKINREVLPEEIYRNNSVKSQPENAQPVNDLKEIKNISEKEAILQALEKTRYNKTKTAKLLGIDRKTLYNKLHLYDIEL